MNEIERAIETIEGYIKAVDQRMKSGDCGVVVGYDAMVDRRAGLKTTLDILRAELSRQENAPLTCEGCRWHPIKYDFLGCIISRCENCCRQTILSDRYEPKGELTCTQD